MKIVKRNPNELKPDENNARSHDEIGVDVLLSSLQAFGQQKPVVIDKNNKIIAGHATVRASIKLGAEEVLCVISKLEGDNKTAYGIADNRCADLATWNQAVLKDIGRTLPENLLMATGFNRVEWERLTKESGLELDIEVEESTDDDTSNNEKQNTPEGYVRQVVLRCTKSQFNELAVLFAKVKCIAKTNTNEDTIMYALEKATKEDCNED